MRKRKWHAKSEISNYDILCPQWWLNQGEGTCLIMVLVGKVWWDPMLVLQQILEGTVFCLSSPFNFHSVRVNSHNRRHQRMQYQDAMPGGHNRTLWQGIMTRHHNRLRPQSPQRETLHTSHNQQSLTKFRKALLYLKLNPVKSSAFHPNPMTTTNSYPPHVTCPTRSTNSGLRCVKYTHPSTLPGSPLTQLRVVPF